MAKDPKSVKVLWLVISALVEVGKLAEAQKAAEQAIASNKANVEDDNLYGWISLLAKGVTDEKITVPQRVATAHPDSAPLVDR